MDTAAQKSRHNFFKADFVACAFLPVQRLGMAIARPPYFCRSTLRQQHAHGAAVDSYISSRTVPAADGHKDSREQCRVSAAPAAGLAKHLSASRQGTSPLPSPTQKVAINAAATLACFFLSGIFQ